MALVLFILDVGRAAFIGATSLLARLDLCLIGLAKPFGTQAADPVSRYACFFGCYGVLLALACLPVRWLPLLALAVGYLGILAVGRAWSANEARRTQIARKLLAGNADELPDLRLLALLSAGLLPVLFPLIFQQMQTHFQLYRMPAGTDYWTWLAFTFDSFCQAFVNWMDTYRVRFTEIDFASPWGRHLVLLKRLTFDFVVIQGLLRILEIRARIREGAAVVRYDAELAARLGKRVVPVLIRALNDPAPRVRQQAALALGEIKDRRAIEPLGLALQADCAAVREAAAQALGELGDARAVDVLVQILHKDDSEKVVLFHDRQSAAQALANLGDPRSLGPLVEALQDTRPEVRAAASRALIGPAQPCEDP
ncbi:MAG TPA: HEAT repeat domain-containing protein [Gemmataceae bacterium]|nr:HEAT repeat domain-containing protein [Gemmataceae bacterium]